MVTQGGLNNTAEIVVSDVKMYTGMYSQTP